MPFIAHQAVKIFILNSSNKWNFPLAEVAVFSLLGLAWSRRDFYIFFFGVWDFTFRCTCGDDSSRPTRSYCLPSSPGQNFEVKADDLEQICELGRGAYGVVDKMRHVPSGLIMAVKVRNADGVSRTVPLNSNAASSVSMFILGINQKIRGGWYYQYLERYTFTQVFLFYFILLYFLLYFLF